MVVFKVRGKLDYPQISMQVGGHFSLFIMKENAQIQTVYCYKGKLKVIIILPGERDVCCVVK